MERVLDSVSRYVPCCEQESRDQEAMLSFLKRSPDALSRDNLTAHVTASAWTVSPDRGRVLMVYHNIYQSWAWTGGHADGDGDLLRVALRELHEETGVAHARALSDVPFSLEILTVDGHEKRGLYVPSHLHLNLTYVLEADDADPLHSKPDENAGARWFTLDGALEACTERWMNERIYSKLNRKLRACAW